MDWLSIETAPKDGNPFLLWLSDSGKAVFIAKRNSNGRVYYLSYVFKDWVNLLDVEAKWMPLPATPASE